MQSLKIDKSFVQGLGLATTPGAAENGADLAIVRAVIAIARSLDLEIVAEGIEHEQTWDLLRDLGGDLAQGYYLSRPIPVAEIERWVQARGYHTSPSTSDVESTLPLTDKDGKATPSAVAPSNVPVSPTRVA